MRIRDLSARRRSFGAVLAAVAFAVMLALPSVALAATFTSRTPAPGATVKSARSTISVSVYDRYGVKGSSNYSMTVDGKTVAARIAYSKSGVYTRFTLTYKPAGNLSVATHRVVVKVKNTRRQSSSSTWSFGVAPVPVTTSDVQSSYEGTATIRLFASAAPAPTALSALESGAGIAHTYYCLDGGKSVEGTVVVALPPSGLTGYATHSISYWSVSTAGVIETPKAATFRVAPEPDRKAPTTAVYGAGHSVGYHSYVGTVTVFLTSEDQGGSGVARTMYERDGRAALEGTRVVIVPPASGSVTHVVKYWAVDNAGNVEAENVFEFVVAAEPVYVTPTTTSNVRTSYAGTATIDLVAHAGTSPIADTYFKIDGGPMQEGTRIVVPAPEEGSENHTIEYWSVDEAGTVEAPHNTATFLVEADMIIIIEPPMDHLVSNGCTISGCHSSNVLTIHNGVYGSPCAVCHAGGVEPTLDCARSDCHPDGMPVYVAPTTTSNVKSSYAGTATIDLVAHGGTSPIAETYYRLDGGAVQEGTRIVVLPPEEGIDNHTIEYWSVDEAGTVETPHRTAAFLVEPDLIFIEPPMSHLVSNGCTITGCHPTDVRVIHGSAYGSPCAICHGGFLEPTLDCARADCHPGGMPPHDTTPPVTDGDFPGSYIGTATIILDPDDVGGSGVAETYYRLDGGSVRTGRTVVVPAPASGTVGHVLSFWSIDVAGNAESPRNYSFTVSAVPSGIEFGAVAPASGSTVVVPSPGISVVVTAPGDIVAASATLDGTARPATLTYPDDDHSTALVSVTASGLADGLHTVSVTVGLASGSHATRTWSFSVAVPDKTGPVTVSDARAAYAGMATIHLTATDNAGGSGVDHTYWRLDGGQWQIDTVPSTSVPGMHTLEFYSVDKAGNAEAHKFVVFKVDLTAPVTVVSSPPSFVGTATIILNPGDGDGSGVAHTYYRLDGGAVTEGTVIVVPAPASGTANHSLTYWSVDNAGNAESPKSFMFTVSAPPDMVAPVTVCPLPPSYVGTAVIDLTPTDTGGWGVASTYYKLDGGPTSTGTRVVVAPPAAGTVPHMLEFWSVDRAGNVEVHKTYSFTVSAAPSSPVTFGTVTPANGSTVSLRSPSISLPVTATAEIVSASATLDGAPVQATVTYANVWVASGYWGGGVFEFDADTGEDVWVEPYYVDTSHWAPGDHKSAVVTVPAANLADGVHTVSVTVTLATGVQSTKAWSFTVAGPV